MCQALDISDTWAGSFFFEDELHLLENLLETVHVIVFVRTPWSFEIDRFFHQMKKKHIPIAFDVDDLVFDIEKIPLLMNSQGCAIVPESYNYWFAYVSRLWMMGKMCDVTIGTNQMICNQLSKTFGKPCYILNNFLNREQIEISEKLYQQKLSNDSSHPNFKIGYFSGSASHNNDFKKIAIELRDLLTQYPEIHLEIVGYMDFPDIFHDLVQKKQVYRSPFVDFRVLQEKIASVQINIVPLIDNVFTNCKSELKFFEAAIVGTITCASSTYIFKESIQHEQTGFYCEEGEWYATLEKVYKNEYSPSLVSQARNYCLEKYSPEKQCTKIEQILEKVMGSGLGGNESLKNP